MKKEKLSLSKIKVSSFITEHTTQSIKGGESVANACLATNSVDVRACLGSLYPTDCCITEYPTHPCTNGGVCNTTRDIAISNVMVNCI